MKRLVFLPLFALLSFSFSAPLTFAFTPPSGVSLLYEHWPTQNGDGASLTFSAVNGQVYSPFFRISFPGDVEIHSVCAAIDSYPDESARDSTVTLGVYEMLTPKTVDTLVAYSDPRIFTAEQYIDWYFAGEETCFSFSTSTQLRKNRGYAIGIDKNTTINTGDNVAWYNWHKSNDPEVWTGSATSFPGIINPTTDKDKPYVRIYGKHIAIPEPPPDPVVIIPGILGSWEKNGMWVLDPFTHAYDNMVDTLEANGYIENETLFTFPYNWRQSNKTTAGLLAQKIEQIKEICSCGKVDLITHSMGGLSALYYIESASYANDVDQLFLIGVPIFGAPKVYKAWGGGEIDLGDVDTNIVLGRIFSREAYDNGFTNIYDYIRLKPIPSIAELLAIKPNYFFTTTTLQYPIGYPRNRFLEDLTNPTKYAKVKEKVRMYEITGDMGPSSTITSFTVDNSIYRPTWDYGEILSTSMGSGDGTVPSTNSTYLSHASTTHLGVNHKGLASSSTPYIFENMRGKPLSKIVGKNYYPWDMDIALLWKAIAPSHGDFSIVTQTLKELFFLNPVGRSFLFIALFSPIDVQVTAPDGKKLGKSADGTILKEIPNSLYSGPVDEYEYVMIIDPMPGQYKVETVGTGGGGYTIAASYITATTTSESSVMGTTTLNQVVSNSLVLSSTSTTVVLTPPAAPIATSSPTTTPSILDTCAQKIKNAYEKKWIKKNVYERLLSACHELAESYKKWKLVWDIPEKKRTLKEKLLMLVAEISMKSKRAELELLVKDKGNAKDAVKSITELITWLKNQSF